MFHLPVENTLLGLLSSAIFVIYVMNFSSVVQNNR
jgi:hypothetical protein